MGTSYTCLGRERTWSTYVLKCTKELFYMAVGSVHVQVEPKVAVSSLVPFRLPVPNGLQPNSDGHQPNSDDLQPKLASNQIAIASPSIRGAVVLSVPGRGLEARRRQSHREVYMKFIKFDLAARNRPNQHVRILSMKFI